MINFDLRFFTKMLTHPEILKKILSLQQFNDEESLKLSNICKPVLLSRKSKLLESDNRFDYVFVLTSGILRWYFYSEDGTENNVFFTSKTDDFAVFGMPEYYDDQQLTKYNIEAVVDTELLLFPKDLFEDLAFNYKGIFQFYIKSCKTIINALRIRTEQLSSNSPSDRYEFFLKNRLYITQNINRKYIASFLGITPNSLSRLSARILKNTLSKK